MTKNIFERILNRIYTAWIVPLREKKYYGDVQKEPLKYLFFPKKSSILVVGFQAFHDTEARYNYVSTLRGCPVSRLYIKDDSASDGRGSYYLGRHGTYSVETLCAELIDRCAKACGATKLVFIGSSKGGYGALNFGIRYPGSDMIIAAPQYYLGNYLNSGRNRSALVDILGREDYSAAEFEQLNFRGGIVLPSEGADSGGPLCGVADGTYPLLRLGAHLPGACARTAPGSGGRRHNRAPGRWTLHGPRGSAVFLSGVP